MLTIGKVAARTKVTPDTLRYYERERLLSPSGKTGAGYRLYDAEAVRSIRFIRHAQECGFALAEIRELLRLRRASGAHCDDVRRRAQKKRLELVAKIRTMQAMWRTRAGGTRRTGPRLPLPPHDQSGRGETGDRHVKQLLLVLRRDMADADERCGADSQE